MEFDKLKYNLYEILGISETATEHKIKKAFKNLILHFHPDKNNKTEEEIYYTIMTANQILTNKEMRKKYNEFLHKPFDSHNELKNKYNKIENNEVIKVSKDEASKIFETKFKELDKKHYQDKPYLDYDAFVNSRKVEANIPYENIKKSEFNQIFENKIIPVVDNLKLSNYDFNENYTSLDIAFNNLYIEGCNINTSKFSSLDSAFSIPKINKVIQEINIKDAINKYNSIDLSKIVYTKEKYETW
jgi:curved DNA-binding protein CbpA